MRVSLQRIFPPEARGHGWLLTVASGLVYGSPLVLPIGQGFGWLYGAALGYIPPPFMSPWGPVGQEHPAGPWQSSCSSDFLEPAPGSWSQAGLVRKAGNYPSLIPRQAHRAIGW